MRRSLRQALRRAPRGLLGMIALIIPCEYYIARNDLKFSRLEAHDWKTTAQAAESADQKGGILCFGDSQVKYGLLPLVMESRIGQPVESLAVHGGQAPSTYFLLRKVLASGGRPTAIVVDWEPHLLKDGVDHNVRMWPEITDLRDCVDLAWTSGSPQVFASTALARYLMSYRERFEIRDNIKAALAGETPPIGERIEMSWRNRLMNRGAVALAKDHAGRNSDLGRWGNPTPIPWYADPVNTAYARRFLKLAQAHNIPVYLTLMPVAPGMQVKYEANGIDAPYSAWVRKLAGRFPNVTVIDARHSNYDAQVFYDALHLDRDGAVAASMAVGDLIKRQVDGQPIVDRWTALPPYRAAAAEVAFEDTTKTYQIMLKAGRTRR